jgi:hypothetical protein
MLVVLCEHRGDHRRVHDLVRRGDAEVAGVREIPAAAAGTLRKQVLPLVRVPAPGQVSAGSARGTVFATKPALARQMITRALDAGTPAAWVTADEVYGQDPALRAELARRGLGYVLAVAKNHPVATPAGTFPAAGLARRLPAGPGSGSPPGPAPRAPAGMTGP